MYPQQKSVTEMMVALGQGAEVRTFPLIIQDPKERLLAANLVIEEAFEFVEALGFILSIDGQGDPVLKDSGAVGNIEDAAKELGDIQVVIDGAANRLGLDMQQVFNEVNASNMSKVGPDGKVIRRESDGKVLKPANYRPANIAGVILEQKKQHILAVVSQAYKDIQVQVAKGHDVYAALTAAVVNEASVTPAVIETLVEQAQVDARSYKLRALTQVLLLQGAAAKPELDFLVKATGLAEDVITTFVAEAAAKFPALFPAELASVPVVVPPAPPAPKLVVTGTVTSRIDTSKSNQAATPKVDKTPPPPPPAPEKTETVEPTTPTPETPAKTEPAATEQSTEQSTTPAASTTEEKPTESTEPTPEKTEEKPAETPATEPAPEKTPETTPAGDTEQK